MATKKTTKKKTTAKKATTRKAPAKKAPPKKKVATKTKTRGAKPTAAKTKAAPKATPASKAKPVPQPEAAKVAPTSEPKPTKAPREQVRDPRLPDPGTVIQKRDRQGNVRCECTVEADGVRYKDTLYRSLSAAAMAAAKDLGLGGKTQNGFTFWGLSKPPRKGADPLAALDKAWTRYRDRLHAVVGNGLNDDNRDQVRALVQQHGEAIAEVRERAF